MKELRGHPCGGIDSENLEETGVALVASAEGPEIPIGIRAASLGKAVRMMHMSNQVIAIRCQD